MTRLRAALVAAVTASLTVAGPAAAANAATELSTRSSLTLLTATTANQDEFTEDQVAELLIDNSWDSEEEYPYLEEDPGDAPEDSGSDPALGGAAGSAQMNPAVWWFVRIVLKESPKHLKTAIKAASKQAAMDAARRRARDAGYSVETVEEPVRGDFKTAGGFTIRWYVAPKEADGYPSFKAFKDRWGAAGEGREWHHIVEQGSRGAKEGTYKQWQIHNRQNLINVRVGLHQKCINSCMATALKNIPGKVLDQVNVKRVAGNRDQTLRYAIGDYSFRNAHTTGLGLLSVCGVKIAK